LNAILAVLGKKFEGTLVRYVKASRRERTRRSWTSGAAR
jgi:hypothetical protein